MLLKQLLKIESALDRINEKLGGTMAKLQDFKDLLGAVNTETDRIAAKLQEVIDKVENSGLTGAEEDEILADLTALRDRTAAIGADPANPVPEVPGEPAPPTP